MLTSRLADVCKGLTDISKNELVDPADRDIFDRLMYKKAEEDEIENSVKMLMRMMNAIYGKKVILLIDECDVPLAKASERDAASNGYYSRMLDVIKGIMSAALKDNEFLQFAVMSGCQSIIMNESIFTGTNNIVSYSVLDERFSEYFGFLEDEVRTLLEVANEREAESEVREWYGGYVFGNSCLYCPWDVINHVSALRYKRAARPKNYWKNASHNGILLTFVKRTDFKVKGKFEMLMNGGTIVQTITDQLTYDTLHSSEDNLWSVLLMTGYVTKADPDEDGETVRLKIPNRESK